MKIDQRLEADVHVMRPQGRIDALAVPEFITAINQMILQGRRKILLDFSQMEFMSSACLRGLMEAQKEVIGRKGTIVFCSVSGQLMELLRVVQLEKLFMIYANDSDALDALK